MFSINSVHSKCFFSQHWQCQKEGFDFDRHVYNQTKLPIHLFNNRFIGANIQKAWSYE